MLFVQGQPGLKSSYLYLLHRYEEVHEITHMYHHAWPPLIILTVWLSLGLLVLLIYLLFISLSWGKILPLEGLIELLGDNMYPLVFYNCGRSSCFTMLLFMSWAFCWTVHACLGTGHFSFCWDFLWSQWCYHWAIPHVLLQASARQATKLPWVSCAPCPPTCRTELTPTPTETRETMTKQYHCSS
jgi:hypothetical protein